MTANRVTASLLSEKRNLPRSRRDLGVKCLLSSAAFPEHRTDDRLDRYPFFMSRV